MKKGTKLSIVISVPILIVIVLVAIVFVMRSNETTKTSTPGAAPYGTGSNQKPYSGFNSASTTTGVGDTSVSSLANDLNSTVDDGGVAGLQQIAQDANGL